MLIAADTRGGLAVAGDAGAKRCRLHAPGVCAIGRIAANKTQASGAMQPPGPRPVSQTPDACCRCGTAFPPRPRSRRY